MAHEIAPKKFRRVGIELSDPARGERTSYPSTLCLFFSFLVESHFPRGELIRPGKTEE